MRIWSAIPVMGMMLVAVACDGVGPAGPGEGVVPVASVVVEPDSVVLTTGASRTLRAVAYAGDGTAIHGRGVVWSSDDTAVVKVDGTGTATARKPGRVTVTAKVEGKTGRGMLVVEAPVLPVASVTVGPDSAVVMEVGGTVRLTAAVWAADGTELGGRVVTWASGDTDIATVEADGTVRAKAAGVTAITATSEGRSGKADVTVRAPAPTVPVAAVEVRPRLVVTYVGVPAPVAVTVMGEDGTVLSGRAVAWSVGDESVATVGADGVVVGRREGETLITATAEGKSATVAVSFRTRSSYHLVFDRESPAFYWMDMRTGVAQKHMEHGAGIRSRDASPSPTRSGFAYVYDFGEGTSPQIAIQSWSGTTYRFLAGGDQPAWSPDGTRIAFRSSHDGRADIWTIDAEGVTGAVNLTADLPEGVNSERPAWSPGGDRIVFAAGNARGGSDLWAMNADGSGKRRLTSGPDRDTEPSWIDDRIVFTRRTAQGTSELYWMFINGALAQRLTANGGAQMPAWSPDGRWIAFVVRDGESGPGDIFAVRPDGSDMRPLSLRTDGPTGGGLNPAWTLHW